VIIAEKEFLTTLMENKAIDQRLKDVCIKRGIEVELKKRRPNASKIISERSKMMSIGTKEN